ncbi:MAG: magnesium chelatase subunit, partial [Actinomycetota bacterium]|nr:magnesium chelatase subunit [Actinomycetota bacterium]
MSPTPGYPFAALVGQDRAKLALLLCVICPRLGGVLLRGEKGTAKSTAARGMAELMPAPTVFRTLPLGATEDRLSGGLDLERTLADGRPRSAPGLLAEVHGGVLYVDEVNLLDDHLVDVLLDVAVSGVVRLEREGLSAAYPSDFALVATMNPEEGALRPHLLDRFGLCVDVTAEADLRARVTVLERRVAYDVDPAAFVAAWAARTDELRQRLRRARLLLPAVRLPGHVAATIAELCTGNRVAGHRADLVLARAASAHAAWSDRGEAGTDDVLAVADLVLTHRRRDLAPEPPPPPRTPSPPSEETQSPQQPEEPSAESPAERSAAPAASGSADADQDTAAPSPPTPDDTAGDGPDDRAEPVVPDDLALGCGDPFRTRPLRPVEDRLARTGSGRRHRSRSADRRGRYVRSRPATDCHDLALDATLRAAAAHQAGRRVPGSTGLVIRPVDWHRKIRRRRVGTLIMFVVDASG